VYNLACPGWGPHQALALLQSGRAESIVDEPPELAIYWAIPDHLLRASGKRFWDVRGPLYEVGPEGRARRAGSFADLSGSPPKSSRPRGLAKRSRIVRRLQRRPFVKLEPSESDMLRWAAIVRSTAEEIERRFPDCGFIVLLDDVGQTDVEDMRAALDDAGIRCVPMSEILPDAAEDRSRWRLHEREGHPSREAAATIARELARRLTAESVQDD
jgi:hypothetical protein